MLHCTCHSCWSCISITLSVHEQCQDQGAYNRAAQRLTFLRSTCDAGSSLGRVIFLINLFYKVVLHSLVFVAVFRNAFRMGMNFVNISLHYYFEYRVFVTSTLKLSLWRIYCQQCPCHLTGFMETKFQSRILLVGLLPPPRN